MMPERVSARDGDPGGPRWERGLGAQKRSMKAFLHIGSMLALVMGATAQGPFQLTATLLPLDPPLPVLARGEGRFTLDGNALRYQVEVGFYAQWTCRIRQGGPDGLVLFELPRTWCEVGIGTNNG